MKTTRGPGQSVSRPITYGSYQYPNGQNGSKESEEKQRENGALLPKRVPDHLKSQSRTTRWLWILVAVSLFIALVFSATIVHLSSQGEGIKSEASDILFDYIVVGGGPSGIIVASKLARKFPSLKVLLLESGTDSQASVLQATAGDSKSSSFAFEGFVDGDDAATLNSFDVPLLWSGLAGTRRGQWPFPPVMNVSDFPWHGHRWPIEKTLLARALGGCGLHNAMLYVRALPSDFDLWNVSGWSYEHMVKHYKELETFKDDGPIPPFWSNTTDSNDSHRGESGPIMTIPAGYGVDAVAPLFVESALQAGFPLASRGFNSGGAHGRSGVGYYEFNIRDGVRDSVARAFLAGKSKPKNLIVQTGATVTRVLMDAQRKGPRAYGVEYMTNNGRRIGRYALRDRERAEIILAAGAIMSPQLLVNSGIGPDGSVVQLEGVGKNLQDHPVVGISFEMNPELMLDSSSVYTIGDELEDYLQTVSELRALRLMDINLTSTQRNPLNQRLGTLGTSGFSAGGFLTSPWAVDNVPDIQLTVFPRQIEPHITQHRNYQETGRLRSRILLVTVALLSPEARFVITPGKVPATVNTTDQKDQSVRTFSNSSGTPVARIKKLKLPYIDIPPDRKQYLTSGDTQRLVWGLQQVRKIHETAPMSMHTGDEVYPGSHVSDEALVQYVHENALTNSHFVGTSRMGTAKQQDAVVDQRLRVIGVRGLRVVDGGVIPTVPNGNTHSTIAVVASHGADLIANDRIDKEG